jgi:hypothetical protein
MVSHFADQFDPLAGSETTLAMVSGLPQRIAQARIQAAAVLAGEVLERARTSPSDRPFPSTRHEPRPNAALPHHAETAVAYGAELTIISLCFGTIAVGMLLSRLL